jgi:hypothetical protein
MNLVHCCYFFILKLTIPCSGRRPDFEPTELAMREVKKEGIGGARLLRRGVGSQFTLSTFQMLELWQLLCPNLEKAATTLNKHKNPFC